VIVPTNCIIRRVTRRDVPDGPMPPPSSFAMECGWCGWVLITSAADLETAETLWHRHRADECARGESPEWSRTLEAIASLEANLARITWPMPSGAPESMLELYGRMLRQVRAEVRHHLEMVLREREQYPRHVATVGPDGSVTFLMDVEERPGMEPGIRVPGHDGPRGPGL